MKQRHTGALAALFVLIVPVVAFSQGTPAPYTKIQYFSNNGLPLALGTLCTFTSGTSTPAVTYTDYTLGTANPLCVVLDSAGRAAIWMDPVTLYRFVLKDSTGVTIWTQDGIPGSGNGGSTGGALWSLNGITINNEPGTRVCISSTSCTSALALLDINGTSSGQTFLGRIDDTANHPGINFYGSGNSFGAIEGTSNGLQLLSGDLFSQIQITSGNVTVLNAGTGTTQLNVTASAAQSATNLQQWNLTGGGTVAFVDSQGRIESPVFNAASTGATITYQNANSLFSVNGFGDLTANGQINVVGTNDTANGGGNTAIKINGLPVIDNTGNATFATLTCTGSPCGSGGGGGGSPVGVTNSIQIKANSTTFGGDANLVYDPSTGIVQLLGAGYVTSHGGFLTDGTANNVIQAPNGGIAGKELIAADSLFFLAETAPALSGAGQSKLYMDSSTNKVMASFNGAALFSLATTTGSPTNGHCAQFDANANVVDAGGACTTGGGGGTVTSSTGNNIAYYPSTGTTVAGSGNFTWNNSTQQFTVTSTATSVAGITVISGFIQADGGFLTTSSSTTAIQAPNGQVVGKTLFTSDSLLFAQEAAPPLSAAGQARVYLDSSAHAIFASVNGGAYAPFGGGSGVSSITGTAGQVNVNTPTGAVILSLPQSIATTSTPTFTGVISNGAFNSTSAGAGVIAFQTNNTDIQIDGVGNISTVGQINVAGSGVYKLAGSVFVDSSRNGFFNNLTVSGTCTGCGGGGGGVTSISGTANEIIASASTGAITLSTPQPIGTSSAVTFLSVAASGSSSFGALTVTQSGLGSLINVPNATAFNSVQTHGGFNADNSGGTASAFAVNSTAVINSSGQYTGAVNTSLASTFGSGVQFNGGLSTNFGTNSVLYVGSSGNFYNRVVSGSSGISCGGITDGWMSVTSDDFVVVCLGGSRFRAALSAY